MQARLSVFPRIFRVPFATSRLILGCVDSGFGSWLDAVRRDLKCIYDANSCLGHLGCLAAIWSSRLTSFGFPS
eukprot:12815471-Alexandrium_andersonii.AAC.1